MDAMVFFAFSTLQCQDDAVDSTIVNDHPNLPVAAMMIRLVKSIYIVAEVRTLCRSSGTTQNSLRPSKRGCTTTDKKVCMRAR